jgi:serine O-acetyltransferase
MTQANLGTGVSTAVVELPALNKGDRNLNPEGIGLVSLLREDLQTHGGDLFEQGFWAVALHRFGNWRMGIQPKVLRAPFSLFYMIMYKVVEWTCGISLPYTVRLGRRVRIWHHGGMILIARSIGDDVHIRQNTTFGLARQALPHGHPTIGCRVDIGCGACILGNITVGDDSRIGANAVVLKDVPPGVTVAGVPARVVRLPTSPEERIEKVRLGPDAEGTTGFVGVQVETENDYIRTGADADGSQDYPGP